MPACLSLRPHPTAQWSRSAAEALHSNCLALHLPCNWLQPLLAACVHIYRICPYYRPLPAQSAN